MILAFKSLLAAILIVCGFFIGDVIKKNKKGFLSYLYQTFVVFIVLFILGLFFFNRAHANEFYVDYDYMPSISYNSHKHLDAELEISVLRDFLSKSCALSDTQNKSFTKK